MENPYTSPQLDPEPARPPLRASFTVGVNEPHAVAIYMAFGGKEVYTVDDVEVLVLSYHPYRKPRRFSLGWAERHEVEVRFHLPPWHKQLWSGHDFHASVYVDGQAVVEDLCPQWRQRAQRWHRAIDITLKISLITLVIVTLAAAIAILL